VPTHHNTCGFADPAWSKDGKYLAFASNYWNPPGPREYWEFDPAHIRDDENYWIENWEIYIMDMATYTISRVTNNNVPDRSPTWSADGTMLYLSKEMNPVPHPEPPGPFWWQNEDIYTVDLTTSPPTESSSAFISTPSREMLVTVRPK